MRNSKSYRWLQRWNATEKARQRAHTPEPVPQASEADQKGFLAALLALLLACIQR